LYCFPFPPGSFDFLSPVAKPYYDFIDWLVPFVGEIWFHLNGRVVYPTFDNVDDSFYGLVFIYLNLIVSLTASIIWSLLDRSRRNYEKLSR